MITISFALNSAIKRCWEISKNESLLGYPDSADEYAGMAEEFGTLIPWIYVLMGQRYTQGMEESGQLMRG